MTRRSALTKALSGVFLLMLFFMGADRDVSAHQGGRFNSAVEFGGKVEFDENPLGVAYGGFYKGGKFLNYIRELNINSTHINIRWKEVEPRKGHRNWRAVDNFVKQLRDGDRALIRIKTNSPWTSRGEASMPKDMEHYKSFVRELVERTEGKVRYFECDWEIDSRKFWDDTPANYVRLLKAFSQTVKGVNPDAMVIFGGHSGHFMGAAPARHEVIEYVFKHGSKYFDIFDLHIYNDLYDIPYRINWFKEKMNELGLSKPMVVTEYGGPTPMEYPDRKVLGKLKRVIKKDYSVFDRGLKGYPPDVRMFAHNIPEELEERRDRLHASEIVQRTLLIISSGPKMVWYWNLVSGGKHPVFGKLGLLNPKVGKKPAYSAYQRMASILGDIKAIERLKMKDKRVYAFKVWGRDGRIVHVLWAKPERFGERAHISLRFPLSSRNVKIVDILGNSQKPEVGKGGILLELTDLPVFIESEPSAG